MRTILLQRAQTCGLCSCKMPSGSSAILTKTHVTHLPGQCGQSFIARLIYFNSAKELRFSAYTPAEAARAAVAAAKTTSRSATASKDQFKGAVESRVHVIEILVAASRQLVLKIHPEMADVVATQTTFQPRLVTSTKRNGRVSTSTERSFDSEASAPFK